MTGLAEILQDPNYVSANAETKAAIFEKHAPNDQNYASANPETQAAIREKFGITTGGAATGNPSIAAQGRKGIGLGFDTTAPLKIGEAGAIGGALGAMSKEILTGAGNVVGAFPQPLAQTAGRFLKGAGQVIGAGGRALPAAAGAISGAAGETAGQAVEAMGGGPVLAETARFVGGGISPELVNVGKAAINTLLKSPAFTTETKLAKAVAKQVMAKLEGNPESLTDIEKKYLDDQIAAIRGPAGKTNQPLEQVGSIMGGEADRLMDSADRQTIAALQKAAGVNVPGQGRQMADVGGDLQGTINTRYKGALDARSKEYKATEKIRDNIVAQREAAGSTVDTTPEYANLVSELKAQLKPGLHSPDVASDFNHILTQISTKAKQVEAPFGGLGADPFASVGEKKPPVSFQQLDEVRRQLGEVFRGKPPEGYKAIDAQTAKIYYNKISDLQEQFAGGKGGPQRKLLDDYADRTEGLNIFSSKYGKKSTALDQYREDTFATDPSSLPGAYFKTRASVQALKELTGDAAKVNNAAMEFANRELAGKDAPAVRKWMGANSEWLAETPVAQRLVDKYATKLEGAERATRNASEFASQAAADATMLTKKALPAQRAVDLITSGDTALWAKVIPAIQQSPQAKTQMVNAVRQVVADQATAKATGDLFSRNIRPFLEGSGIANKAEMDFIAQKLASIQAMQVPEAEKLGFVKRILLQATGGWAASAAARAGVNTYQWTKEKMVPE